MKEEILKRVDILADKLGVAANYVFKLYVAQARVIAVSGLIYLLVSLILGWLCYKTVNRHLDQPKQYRSDWTRWATYACITGFGFVVFFICFLCSDALTAWINPQYWAFHQILTDITESHSSK